MRLHCETCNLSLSVPEEKIPQGKGVKLLCPKCRNPIGVSEQLAGPGRPDGGEQLQPAGVGRWGADAPIEPFERNEADEEAALVDIVEEGIRTALVFISDPQIRKVLTSTLGLMDFYVVVAGTASFALRKIQHNHYDMVFVDDVAGAGAKHINPLLYHLQLLAMPVRRHFFLCLLSNSLSTMDKMTAYRLGVNLIVNNRDLSRAKIIITRALKEHNSFYKLFEDELLRKGQL